MIAPALRDLPPPAWRPTPRTRADLGIAGRALAGAWVTCLVEPTLGAGCALASAGWLARRAAQNRHLTALGRAAFKARAYEVQARWMGMTRLEALRWDEPGPDYYVHVQPEDWMPAGPARPPEPQDGLGAHVREWRHYKRRARMEGLRVVPRRVYLSVPWRAYPNWRAFRSHWNRVMGFPGTPERPVDPWRWDRKLLGEGFLVGEPFSLPPLMPLPELASWSPNRIVLGVLEDGTELVWDPTEIPHVLLGGSTRFGKTGILRLIALQFILGSWQRGDHPGVVILDPKGDEYVCFERDRYWNPSTIEGIHVAVDDLDADGRLVNLDNMLAACRAMVRELARRRRASRLLARAGREVGWRPVVLIVDEAAELLAREPVPQGDDDAAEAAKARNGQRAEIERAIASIARMGAKFRVHVVAAAQSPRAEFLPSDAKINLAFLLFVGPGNPTELGIIFGKDLPDSPPARRGMGVWKDHREGVDPLDPYLYFKAYWADPDVIGQRLDAALDGYSLAA